MCLRQVIARLNSITGAATLLTDKVALVNHRADIVRALQTLLPA